MSKIFDALQGTKTEAAEFVSSLLHGASEPADTLAQTLAPPLAPPQEPLKWRPRIVSLAVPASAPLLPFEKAGMPGAEQYRIARTKITHHPKHPKIIVLTSPSTGDGKSITAINLAAALSLKADSKVLLIDGDFRSSAIHRLLGLPPEPGVAELIAFDHAFEDLVVQAEQYPNLNILVSGSSNVNPAELLDSKRWQELCDLVRSRYQYVIIDSPPISMVADFELIQLATDGTILVMRPEHTKRTPALKALEVVPKEKLLGVILNCVENWVLFRHEGYGYPYGNSYGAENGSKVGREKGTRPRA